ncbi:dynamin family protein [Paenibacillus sp. PL91]|uniref:dynamin family protein n=1 Tax=Paenibacillus sp. PL91 TaxID=2729538 RepID=UPI00145D48FD|nr:dynamin family protein [Paenibacillus sp. PL91]MBC9203656.1 dynamin family protein [Paenibacillus sp. PL91]
MLIVSFTGNDVLIRTKESDRSLPPIFYYFKKRVMLGGYVARAIDLFPEYIYSVYSDHDEERLTAFFLELHEYIAREYDVHDYQILLQAEHGYLKKAAASILPNIPVKLANAQSGGKKVPALQSIRTEQVLSQIIANHIIRSGRLPGGLYGKIKRILFMNINRYLKELLDQGSTAIRLKAVSRSGIVHTVQQEVNVEIPSIRYLLQLHKQVAANDVERIRDLYHLYDENASVTFISPFSYGKSTLINGLFGESMLAMDIRAETAIITKVVSADENRLFVKYDNDRITMEKFGDYAELKEKLSMLSGVRSAEIPAEVQIHHTLDSFPGLTIVDAPGLNSRHACHNEIAEQALKMSDLILFLIHPASIGDAAFSRQMKQFLEMIKESGQKHGFVLTKWDQYSNHYDSIIKELAIVLDEVDSEAERHHVFFVSGYFALYGKQLRDEKINIDEVRKEGSIYVIEDDEIIAGRRLEQDHAQAIIQLSRIGELEHFILEGGDGGGGAANELHMDYGKQKTVRVT